VLGITTLLEKIGIKSEEKKQYKPDQISSKKYSFRPQTLSEYVGQERAKELVELNLKKIETIKPVHFIINGTRGHGKSTLAYIIAKRLNFRIHTYIGGSFTMENLSTFLQINQDSTIQNILFIDEIHGLEKTVAEFMYPILEDFILPKGNLKLRPFVFIGATTDKNVLMKKFSPFIDRCGAQINLEHYNALDIKTILKQYNAQIYQKNVSEDVYDLLAVNTRFNPRTYLALFDALIVCEDIKKVLSAHRVIKNSLTTDDVLILEHLAEIQKPIGVETLSIIIQQTKQDYITLVEPFLLQQGYLSRTARGRIITNKGIQILKEINGETK